MNEIIQRSVEDKTDLTQRKTVIHPLSGLILLLVDGLWTLDDWNLIMVAITIPLSFMTVFLPTFFIQKTLRRDSVGKAFVLALVLGIIGALPFHVAGTAIGAAILAWAGITTCKFRR